MNNVSIHTTQHVPLSYDAANLGSRIGAFVLDLLFYVAWLILYNIIEGLFDSDLSTASQFALWLPAMVYSLVCEVLFDGQTLGKMVARIRVISKDGVPATFANFFMRWMFRIIDIFMSGGSVAVVTILMNGKGQRLGDIAAGTAVISLNKKYNINTNIAAEIDSDYDITYKEVANLTDYDILLIKKIFNYAFKRRNFILLEQLSEQVSLVLNVKVENDREEFLRTVVKDYQFMMSVSN
ncbi:MAG: RDD family protein [Bacteroidetes bacterium]|nr:RDD family protein [Bacteroidota bacterium]